MTPLWMGFNWLPQGYRATLRRQFIFYKFPKILGIYSFYQPWKDESGFEHRTPGLVIYYHLNH